MILGGAYEYVCSAVTELLFGTVFWDYSELQVQSGRAHQPAVLLLLGHCGRDLDPLWLPAGGKGDEGGQAQDPSLDDRSAGRVHGREPCDASALALARYDATHQRRGSGQCWWMCWLDEHFDNARMERIYPNAKKVEKAG